MEIANLILEMIVHSQMSKNLSIYSFYSSITNQYILMEKRRIDSFLSGQSLIYYYTAHENFLSVNQQEGEISVFRKCSVKGSHYKYTYTFFFCSHVPATHLPDSDGGSGGRVFHLPHASQRHQPFSSGYVPRSSTLKILTRYSFLQGAHLLCPISEKRSVHCTFTHILS